MSKFETNRLICRSLSLAEYEDFEQGSEPNWIDCTNDYLHLTVGPNPLHHRIPRVRKDSKFAEIGLFLAIDKDTRIIAGSAGFHDFPDERGMIEIGYGIVPEMQGRGLGKELLLAAWKWVLEYPNVKVLRYTVSESNDISLHIIQSLGFDFVGQQIDETDGPEQIYEMAVESFRKNFS